MGDLRTAAESGDRVKALEQLRDYLAGQLEGEPDERAVAPIAKQFADVMRELAALNPLKEKSTVDELSKRRAVRRKKAAVPDRAAGGKQRGRGGRRPAEGGEPAT